MATFTESETKDLRPQGSAREEPKTRMQGQVQIREELLVLQKQEMQVMVWEFKDIFHEEPGWVQNAYHTIDTPPGAIVWERWQPVPHHLLSEIHKEIEKMLEQEVIQPSRSPW